MAQEAAEPGVPPQSTGQESPEEAPAAKDAVNLFILADRSYLDKKINVEGQTPRLVETVKDGLGNVLIRKYEKLNKAIWQKYRTKPECRPLHFISEIPLYIIDEINATFLLPEDLQMLGALYHRWGKDAVAEQFFFESAKSNTADAHLNAGVFRYLRGEQGVMDNFALAKKHFNKAMGLLELSPMSPEEKLKRIKLCQDAIDEIDYRFAPIFDKIIRFLIRLLTFRFFTDVFFIGAAAEKDLTDDKIKMLIEGIVKREMDMKRSACKKLILDLHGRIPPDQPHLEDELNEIETEYADMSKPELLDVAVARLGEFVTDYAHHLTRESAAPEPVAPEEDAALDPHVACYELADAAAVENVAVRYKLISMADLLVLVRQKLDPPVVAWLIRDKIDQAEAMEKLVLNPCVPDRIKEIIRRRLPG